MLPSTEFPCNNMKNYSGKTEEGSCLTFPPHTQELSYSFSFFFSLHEDQYSQNKLCK